MSKKLLSAIPLIFFRRKIKAKNSVVLVHGLWMNHWSMYYLGWHFKRQGFAVYYFDYPSRENEFQANVSLLNQYIQKIDSDNVSLVGHSLGGLICLEYMRRFDSAQIAHCILLGSPINGSQVAATLSAKRWGRFLLGSSVEPLTQVHICTRPEKTGLVIGTGGKGLGHWFAPLHRPHDGAVAVREVRTQSVESQIVLEVSHSPMLFSKSVAHAAVQFCRTGAFV